MSGYTPDQEIALCEKEIESFTYNRDQHQRTVDMFDEMIADNRRRIAQAQQGNGANQ